MGLAVESLIGFESNGKEICTVPEWQLKNLLEISNERFVENSKRIERFRQLLNDGMSEKPEARKKGQEGDEWEDPQVRKERKRAEGLKMKELAREEKEKIERGAKSPGDDDQPSEMELLNTF